MVATLWILSGFVFLRLAIVSPFLIWPMPRSQSACFSYSSFSCSADCGEQRALTTKIKVSRRRTRPFLHHRKAALCARGSKMHKSDMTSHEHAQTWHIGEDEVGQRLDRYLVAHLADVSRTTVQQMIAD